MGWNISHERQQLISSLMTLGAFIGSCSAGMQLKFCVKTHCIDHPRPGSRVHRAQDQSLRCRPPMLRRKHCYDDDYEYGRALRGPSHYWSWERFSHDVFATIYPGTGDDIPFWIAR